MIGVLGGMGPLATVDFVEKIIYRTPAEVDQDHVPMVIYNVPQIPDRTNAIFGTGETPLPALIGGVEFLNKSGASLIAIPCNTAHHWYAEMAEASQCPVAHIADAAIAQIDVSLLKNGVLGLLATSGTLRSGIYQARFRDKGFDCILPSVQDETMDVITHVKKGQIGQAVARLKTIVDELIDRGAEQIVLGCTEIPIAAKSLVRPGKFIDATDALAQFCVHYSKTANAVELYTAKCALPI